MEITQQLFRKRLTVNHVISQALDCRAHVVNNNVSAVLGAIRVSRSAS